MTEDEAREHVTALATRVRLDSAAAAHPLTARVLSLVLRSGTRVSESAVAINEVFGWMTRCAVHNAHYANGRVLSEGVASLYGGDRTARLLELAVRSGYVEVASRRPADVVPHYRFTDEAALMLGVTG